MILHHRSMWKYKKCKHRKKGERTGTVKAGNEYIFMCFHSMFSLRVIYQRQLSKANYQMNRKIVASTSPITHSSRKNRINHAFAAGDKARKGPLNTHSGSSSFLFCGVIHILILQKQNAFHLSKRSIRHRLMAKLPGPDAPTWKVKFNDSGAIHQKLIVPLPISIPFRQIPKNWKRHSALSTRTQTTPNFSA